MIKNSPNWLCVYFALDGLLPLQASFILCTHTKYKFPPPQIGSKEDPQKSTNNVTKDTPVPNRVRWPFSGMPKLTTEYFWIWQFSVSKSAQRISGVYSPVRGRVSYGLPLLSGKGLGRIFVVFLTSRGYLFKALMIETVQNCCNVLKYVESGKRPSVRNTFFYSVGTP